MKNDKGSLLYERLYAWPLFFGPAIQISPLPAVRPYVIEIDAKGADIHITLRIIGFPISYLEEARDALIDALQTGVAIKKSGRQRVRFEVAAQELRWCRSVVWSDHVRYAKLMLETPLAIRRKKALAGTIDTLPVNLWNRLRALARWQDIDVTPLGCSLKTAFLQLDHIEYDLEEETRRRHSSSTGKSGQIIRGYIGHITLQGDLSRLMPLLAFGELFHAGSSCAQGFGRYKLVVI